MGKYIDFAYVNAHGDFRAVLDHYGLDYTRRGEQLRLLCPFHEDTKPSLSITLVAQGEAKANTFHCFGCGKSGSIIDFVAEHENTGDLRSAAEIVARISGAALAAPRVGQRAKGGKGAKGVKSPSEARRTARAPKDRPAPPKATEAAPEASERLSGSNPPLGFRLKTTTDHPYLAQRVSSGTIKTFELGYVPTDRRGLMAGRLVIPLHDIEGQLVGYLGRHAGDPVPEDQPKYLVPPEFNKQAVLFNAHRIAHSDDIVLVEGAFDAMRLHMLGIPAVAVLGTAVSAEQLVLLRQLGTRRALILFDGDAAGRKAAETAAVTLAHMFFVTVETLPDGLDPEAADEPVLKALATRFG